MAALIATTSIVPVSAAEVEFQDEASAMLSQNYFWMEESGNRAPALPSPRRCENHGAREHAGADRIRCPHHKFLF